MAVNHTLARECGDRPDNSLAKPMDKLQGIFFKDFKNAYLPEIFKELYRDCVYDPYLQGKNDLTILDIGANIGLFSFYAQEFAKRIYAVEPSKYHFETLTKMLEFNEFKNVTPINLALANENKTLTLNHNANNTMFSLKDAVKDPALPGEEVDAVTIEELLKRQQIEHVDFMKLDVEGAEMEIIGGEAFDRVASKIDVVMGENHQWNATNPEQLKAAFIDRGFKFEWLRSTEAALFVAKRWIGKLRYKAEN